jgi:hypothetical protein
LWPRTAGPEKIAATPKMNAEPDRCCRGDKHQSGVGESLFSNASKSAIWKRASALGKPAKIA